MFIDDTPGITLAEMRAKARRLKQQEGRLDLIVIDYLQLMTASSGPGKKGFENRNQEVAAVSRGLKALAKEMKVPVIALSQLSRASEQRGGDKKPMLSDLRESGSIEQDADVVCFIHRDSYYNKDENGDEDPESKGKAEIIIAKQRNGPTGSVHLAYLSVTTRASKICRAAEITAAATRARPRASRCTPPSAKDSAPRNETAPPMQTHRARRSPCPTELLSRAWSPRPARSARCSFDSRSRRRRQHRQAQLPLRQPLSQPRAVVAAGPLRPNRLDRRNLLRDVSADVHHAIRDLRPARVVVLLRHAVRLQTSFELLRVVLRHPGHPCSRLHCGRGYVVIRILLVQAPVVIADHGVDLQHAKQQDQVAAQILRRHLIHAMVAVRQAVALLQAERLRHGVVVLLVVQHALAARSASRSSRRWSRGSGSRYIPRGSASLPCRRRTTARRRHVAGWRQVPFLRAAYRLLRPLHGDLALARPLPPRTTLT